MVERVVIPRGRNRKQMWRRYCGFLELSIDEFTDIQDHLLREQLEMLRDSRIARTIVDDLPDTPEEFRRRVPLTTYSDYADLLQKKDESVLPEKPYTWAMTSGRSGKPKWVPYTSRFVEYLAQMSVAVVILACAEHEGDVQLRRGFRVLVNLPSPPYMTGILNDLLAPKLGARVIPPADIYRDAEFETKIQEGFRIALSTGVDLLSSMTSVLIRMGESFSQQSSKINIKKLILKPKVLARLGLAYLRAKRDGRSVLPKDIWPLKGLSCYGMDTSIYRQQLNYYWGKPPFESYGATETGVIAISGWTKRFLTFLPASAYIEFLPVDGDGKTTVTLKDVRIGERYELVVSSFYGMPFLRYRMGDVMKFVAPSDDVAGVELPQAVFESRIDDIVDIAGFTRLDERTIAQALVESGLKVHDWTARKEYVEQQPILRLYVEPANSLNDRTGVELIHEKLASINADYADLERMLGLRPLQLVVLKQGAFKRYYEARKREGLHLAHLKPPHMNATDGMIAELMN